MDRFILDHTKQSAALERLKRTFIEGDPEALLCVEFYADTKDELTPRLDAIERDLTARRLRLPVSSSARSGRAGRHLVACAKRRWASRWR